ncbi:E3 ubiquitin-protein ligase rad18 [Naganishia albida]|nr:E3 ubiquitin-protein ligase rad18 [Naganishia albida]
MQQALDKLDAALECPICKHGFTAPVSLACGHGFCSRCIRDALQEKKECPVCREEAREGQVRRTRVVEELVGVWAGIRDDLLHLSHPQKRHASLPPAPPAKRRRTTPLGNGTKPDAATIVLDLDESDEEVVPLDREAQIESGMVTCPACGQNLPLASLNAHLDRGCPPIQAGPTTSSKASWAALFSSAQPPSTGGSRADADAELASKRITKPNYALVSTKELRGLLETYGCATVGERGVLVERVQLWISIFNANLDASHPRTLKSLRAELDTQERARNRDKEDAGRAKQAFVNATGDDEAFKRLEKELRRRKKGEVKGS